MTNLKKIGLASLALIIAAGVYYFSAGSEKIATAMKTEVKAKFDSLKNQGFTVESKVLSTDKEQYVFSFNDTDKIAAFLVSEGTQISTEDAKVLKGLKFGVDVSYLADAYSAVSLDIYPITLPSVLTENIEDPEEKKLLAQVKEMLAEKIFLMHVDVNKLGTGFKGYMKDVDTTLQAKEALKYVMKDFRFKGELEDEKLTRMMQVLKSISLSVSNDMLIEFKNIQTQYEATGTSQYAYDTSYNIERIQAKVKNEFNLDIQEIDMHSLSSLKDALVALTFKGTVKHINFSDATQNTSLDEMNLAMNLGNLPLSALEKIEMLDPEDEAGLKVAIRELLAEGVIFKMKDFSVKTLQIQDKKIDGFDLNAALSIDKNLDFTLLDKNPMQALSFIDADLKLTVSDDLFALSAQQPQAVMVMMLIQPETVNGKKVYKVELKDGKVNVNGKAMF